MNTPTTGARIKAARKQLGLSQTALAEKMGDQTPSQISVWETQNVEPTPDNMKKLEKFLFSKLKTMQAEAETPLIPSEIRVVKEPVSTPVEKQIKPVPVGIRSSLLFINILKARRDPTVINPMVAVVTLAKVNGYTLDDLIALLEAAQG